MKKAAVKPRMRAVKKNTSTTTHWVQVIGSGRGRFCRHCEALIGHYYPSHHAPHVPPTGCRCSMTVIVSVHEDDVPDWVR